MGTLFSAWQADHAGLAAHAGVHVDGHAPAIAGILLGRVEARQVVLHRLAAQRLLAGCAQIDVLGQLALVLIVGGLQDGEGPAGAGLGQGHRVPR